DAHVVIIGDNDPIGRQHARDVAQSLDGVATCVQLIESMPDVPEKGDVVDWLAAGHTGDDLLALVSETPEWTSADAQQEWPTPLPLSTIPEHSPFPVDRGLTPKLAALAKEIS